VKKRLGIRKKALSILIGCTVFGLIVMFSIWRVYLFMVPDPFWKTVGLWLFCLEIILGGLTGWLCSLSHERLKSWRNLLVKIAFEGFLGLVYGFVLGVIAYGTPLALSDQCDLGICDKGLAPLFAMVGGLFNCILGGVVGLILSQSR
jgi:H+/Cl- antiporter ClcA